MSILQIVIVFLSASLWTSLGQQCPSQIPESDRVDCYPESGASQASCRARGCEWCPLNQGSLMPWCFFNTFLVGTESLCYSQLTENQKIDCHPGTFGSIVDQIRRCVALGCVWCPTSNVFVPDCFQDPDLTGPQGTTPTTIDGCSTTIPEPERVDCLRFDEHSCTSNGCLWCPTSDPGIPWCFYKDQIQPTNPGQGQCTLDVPEDDRIDCHPDPGSSYQSCIDRDCFWCESQTNGVPWCYFNSTGWITSDKNPHLRVSCNPEPNVDFNKCQQRGCIFERSSIPNAPWCYFPDDWGYTVDDVQDTANGQRVTFTKKSPTIIGGVGGEITRVALDVEYQTNERLRLKFYDPNKERFEVPLNIPSPMSAATDPKYEVRIIREPSFAIEVVRRSSGEALFNTSVNGFVFEDQFLQIATKLPTDKLYGFGEHEHHSFKHNMDYVTWPMWARDQPPSYKANLYGAHPFYMCVENDANAHGVLFLNAAAQDVTTSPAPMLTYRTIGGILDIYIFVGDSPENVVQCYTEAVGRPFMPPYWGLGFQLSRYGYNSLATMRATFDRNQAAGIPQDVQVGDIDYFRDQLDFTYNQVTYAGFPEFIREIQAKGVKFISILDPCIDIGQTDYPAFELGQESSVWVTQSDGVTPAAGKVWPPNHCYFPDYTSPHTHQWWIDECVKFHNVLPFDGLWIDMNEPANFVEGGIGGCDGNQVNYPDFIPKIWGSLPDKSLCPDFRHHIGRHYDVHNLYGWSQAEPTLRAARAANPGKRSIVLSRSTYPGIGKWAVHWLGDNFSQWSNLHYSIIGMLEFNLFGIPYAGSDICGFIGDTNEPMCRRWMQLGAFYPFSRNHNGLGYRVRTETVVWSFTETVFRHGLQEQDPAAWSPEVTAVMRDALLIRYRLLPYLYTLFHDAHVHGNTVARPLLHEFTADEETHTVDGQFLWGAAFMISPVVEEFVETKDIYFPDARWYDYYSLREESHRGDWATVPAPVSTIPLHFRGGFIVPLQEPAINTDRSRNNPMGLIAALDDDGAATGKLFWDDGDSIDTYENGNYMLAQYSATSGRLRCTVTHNQYAGAGSVRMNDVEVVGVRGNVVNVTVNGQTKPFTLNNQVLKLTNLQLPLNQDFTITWS